MATHDSDLDKYLPELTSKITPVGADYTYLTDTEDANISKKLSLSNLQNNFLLPNYSPFKDICFVATSSNITLSGEQDIDGYMTNNSRVLVRQQTSQIDNGIYLSAAGAWTREPDFAIGMDVNCCYVPVLFGALGLGAYTLFVVGNSPTAVLGTGEIIVGTDDIMFNGGFNPKNLVKFIDPVETYDVTNKGYVDGLVGDGYVPYNGAVDNVDLGMFDLIATGIFTNVGQITSNAETLDIFVDEAEVLNLTETSVTSNFIFNAPTLTTVDGVITDYLSLTGLTISATGASADINLNISAKGIGYIKANSDLVFADGNAIKTGTANGDDILFQVYDVNGTTYRTFGQMTAGDIPVFAWSQPSGGTLTWDGGAIGSITPAAGTFTTLTATDFVISTISTGTSNGNTVTFRAYDVDNTTYRTFGTLTAANTPSLAFAQPSGGTLTWDGGAIGATTPSTGAFTSLSTTLDTVLGGDLAVNGGDITTSQTTFNLITTTATILNLGSASSFFVCGYTGTANSTMNISNGAIAAAGTKTINLGTGGAASSTTNINVGSSNGGTFTVNSNVNNLTMSNNVSIRTTTTTANNFNLQAYDVDNTTYRTFIQLLSGNTPSIAISAPSGGSGTINNIPIGGTTPETGAFTSLTLSNAGGLRTTTTTANTFLLQAYDVDNATYRTFGTFTSGNTPTAAFSQPSGGTLTWDGGVIGGTTAAAATFTTLTSDSHTLTNGSAIRTTTTSGQTVNFQAYNNTGSSYFSFMTLTAGTTPSLSITATNIGASNLTDCNFGSTMNFNVDTNFVILNNADLTTYTFLALDTGVFPGTPASVALSAPGGGGTLTIDGAVIGGTTAAAATVTSLAINGSNLTTNQTTFNLVNATATTVNAFGAATTIHLGKIDNATQVTLGGTNPLRMASIGAAAGTAAVIDSNGDLQKLVSSARYKTDIVDLDLDSELLYKLRPVSFKYKLSGDDDFGLIAEEVNDVLPQLVNYDSEMRPESVKYSQLPVIQLMEMVKLKEELTTLTHKYESLSSKFDNLPRIN